MSGMTGSEFKAIRDELGLTQGQLAEVVCLSGNQAVCNIETGVRNPGRLLAAIMQAFVELPEKRSKELRELLISISRKQSGSNRGRR